MRWPAGWNGQGSDAGEAALSMGQEGRAAGHNSPMGLAQVVPREAKGHGRDSSEKGDGVKEGTGQGKQSDM